MEKLWGGRFTKETNKLVDEFTASIHFDQKLALEDIEGSLAHVQMLGECGIIPLEDADAIIIGLEKIEKKIVNGEVEFATEHEDIHMNIEKMLHDEIGPVAGKLHTGRSRNDQVATDMHIYLKRKTVDIIKLVEEVPNILI